MSQYRNQEIDSKCIVRFKIIRVFFFFPFLGSFDRRRFYKLKSVCLVVAVGYPAPPPSYAAGEQAKEGKSGPYVAAPPPVGYPVRDGPQYPHQTNLDAQTQSRGDGFWKGWLVVS